jgi:4-alpha-glucanotransferase
LPDPDFVAAVHAFLAKTASALALVQIDDLLGETSAVNLPGTDRERPNWRRKLTREAAGALPPAMPRA